MLLIHNNLGAKKRLKYKKFYFFLILLFLTWSCSLHVYNSFCLSIILSIQYSDETYKHIKLTQHYTRTKYPLSCTITFNNTYLGVIFIFYSLLWLYNLILLSGDIHQNPGPASGSSQTEGSFSSLDSRELLSNHLSILHLNIQSLLPKIDLIRAETDSFDIAIFSESWLKPCTTDDEISLVNFLPPFRTDRLDRPGGGVIIYARDNIACKRRKDIEINGLEAVWLEVKIKSKKILVGGIYRPPNSNSAYFDLIIESIDRAHNTNIYDIIITGDFNYKMISGNSNKIKDLLQQYNLTQLIDSETHFTETSASLIDLIMV